MTSTRTRLTASAPLLAAMSTHWVHEGGSAAIGRRLRPGRYDAGRHEHPTRGTRHAARETVAREIVQHGVSATDHVVPLAERAELGELLLFGRGPARAGLDLDRELEPEDRMERPEIGET